VTSATDTTIRRLWDIKPMNNAARCRRTWAERDAVPESVKYTDEDSGGAGGAAASEVAAAEVAVAVRKQVSVSDQAGACDGDKCAVVTVRSLRAQVKGSKVGVLAAASAALQG
jgi:hypothetical protein